MKYLMTCFMILFFQVIWGQTNLLPLDGNVGIGDTTPIYKLEVTNTTHLGAIKDADKSGIRISRFNTALTDVPGSTGGTQIKGPIHGHVVFDIEANDNNDGFYIRLPQTLQPYPTVDNTVFSVKANKRVGIGTSQPSFDLHINNSTSNSLAIGKHPNYLLLRNNIGGTNEIRSYGRDLEIETRNDTEDIFFNTNNGARKLMTIKGQGNIGIGTTNPQSKLEVYKTGTIGGTWNPSSAYLKLTDGNAALIADGNEITTNTSMYLGAAQDIFFRNVTTSTNTDLMAIKANGNVGIGIISPQNKLDVNGTVRAKEILVEEGWGDYVFLPDYKRLTLAEESKFIQKNGRLSGFQSAEEMNGEIQLGDVTKRQQVKIEEMMLHMIEMKREIEMLRYELNKKK